LVFNFSAAFLRINIKINILIASIKNINYFLRFDRKPHQNFFSVSLLCHWLIFSSVHPLLDAGKLWEDLHDIGGFLYAATSSLMRVTEMLLKLVSVSVEGIQHFRYYFLSKKEANKLENHQRTYRKY
jgi:hypothetical protein